MAVKEAIPRSWAVDAAVPCLGTTHASRTTLVCELVKLHFSNTEFTGVSQVACLPNLPSLLSLAGGNTSHLPSAVRPLACQAATPAVAPKPVPTARRTPAGLPVSTRGPVPCQDCTINRYRCRGAPRYSRNRWQPSQQEVTAQRPGAAAAAPSAAAGACAGSGTAGDATVSGDNCRWAAAAAAGAGWHRPTISHRC
jgi:hypothetical protein